MASLPNGRAQRTCCTELQLSIWPTLNHMKGVSRKTQQQKICHFNPVAARTLQQRYAALRNRWYIARVAGCAIQRRRQYRMPPNTSCKHQQEKAFFHTLNFATKFSGSLLFICVFHLLSS